MTYNPTIGVLDIKWTIEPMLVTASEYMTDGPANDWPAPVTLAEWLADNPVIGADVIASGLQASGRVRVGGVLLIDLDGGPMTNDAEHQTLFDFASEINAWLSDLLDGQEIDWSDVKAYLNRSREILSDLKT